MLDLHREIKIKDAYLGLIADLGYDYDGYETVEGLKSLIDELVELAVKGMNNDDESVMSFGDGKLYNILGEKIGEYEGDYFEWKSQRNI